MLNIILYMDDEFAQPLKEALDDNKHYKLYARAASVEKCVEYAAQADNSAIIFQIKQPVWPLQNLLYELESHKCFPILLGFHEISDFRLDFYMSSPELYPQAKSVSELFENTFSPLYMCRLMHCRISDLEREKTKLNEGECTPNFGKESALMEILRGCSYNEYLAYKKKYNLNLKDCGYYVFFHDLQYVEYSAHAANKDIYNYIGELLKIDCYNVVNEFNGGEVLDLTLNLQCVIINDLQYLSENKKKAHFSNLLQQLAGITNCRTSARYLSPRISRITQLRSAYDSYHSKKSAAFFNRSGFVLLSETDYPSLHDSFEQARALLQTIQTTIKFDITSPELTENLRKLFFEVIKPSYSFSLFYFCIAVISNSLNSEQYGHSERTLESLDPQRICYSSIEFQYEMILSRIIAMQSQYSNKRQSRNTYVLKTIQYISDHYNEDILVSDISSALHINSTYLSKLFKAQVGIGIINYLNNHRINMAKNLLAETDLMIYDIAERVGYNDSRYFSKVFSKQVGMTPKQYRNKKASKGNEY